MLRSSLFLLLSATFATATFAQGHRDIQSLEYEFGRAVSPAVPAITPVPKRPTVTTPCPCEKPIVYAPVARGYCCAPVYTVCCPVYKPCTQPCCYPAPKVYRRTFIRPVYHSPYYCW